MKESLKEKKNDGGGGGNYTETKKMFNQREKKDILKRTSIKPE